MLQLDENWRIRTDSMCWVLEKKLVNQESFETNWQTKGYYQYLDDALRGACNQMLKAAKDIPDLLHRIEELHRTIRVTCPIKLKPPALRQNNDDDTDFLEKEKLYFSVD